jgi:hypothetical protein
LIIYYLFYFILFFYSIFIFLNRNASYRRKDEEYLYITPSGLRKQHMNAELIFKLKFVDDYKTTDEPSLVDIQLRSYAIFNTSYIVSNIFIWC